MAGATILIVVAAASCHRVATTPNQECRPNRRGTASVEFGAAATRSERYGDTALGGAVVRVVQGTMERTALEEAQVFFLAAGLGPDSGQQITRRSTGAAGVIMVDSLMARRYEVKVRRIGYVSASQHLTVRPRFIDTLVVALQVETVCLVEQRLAPNGR